MNKSGREKLNLFFSAFLVAGYVVCAYFFTTLASSGRMTAQVSMLINVAVFVLFGLILFYATRVGEGVPVKRFSLIILCVLDIPALFVILAALLPAFPLNTIITGAPAVWMLAAVALGYGIPYTFLSGFEMVEEAEELEEVVEGGIAEELAETEEKAETEEVSDDVADEKDVEELEALDGAEKSADAE